MSVDIDSLLALPPKERRKIAEQLWHSLSPSNAISKEDEEVIALLNKRWEDIQSEKSTLYSRAQMKQMVTEHRNK